MKIFDCKYLFEGGGKNKYLPTLQKEEEILKKKSTREEGKFIEEETYKVLYNTNAPKIELQTLYKSHNA